MNNASLEIYGMTTIILPYMSYILMFYNINYELEIKSKSIILNYLYYMIYNVNNSMNLEMNFVYCFKDIKNNYMIDKLYIYNKENMYNIVYEYKEYYCLINFIIYDFNNTANLTNYPILFKTTPLHILEYRKNYIITIFSDYISSKSMYSHEITKKINKKINKLINNNIYTIKNIIKFIIIVSSIVNDNIDEYVETLSYFYNFIVENFNYKDLEEIINVTNNITNLQHKLFNKYHSKVLYVISNFKDLCEDFLKNNNDITSKLQINNQNNYYVLNNNDLFIIVCTDFKYFLNKNEKLNYITNYYNLIKKHKYINSINIKNLWTDITILYRDKSSIILENNIFYSANSIGLSYNLNTIDIIFPFEYNIDNLVKILSDIHYKCNICINVFTALHYNLLKIDQLSNNRYITLKSYRDFDLKFYNINTDIQYTAYDNICSYYIGQNNPDMFDKYDFIFDSLHLIYYNGYDKVGKLLENTIDIIFYKKIDFIIYYLSYIVYYLNIDSELFDYIMKIH